MFMYRCRLIIQIDDTHLYDKYRGKLLITTFVDSNKHLLPLVFLIVEEECKFMRMIFKTSKNNCTHEDICFVSNKHVGIILNGEQSKEWVNMTKIHHRFCLHHIISIFNKSYNFTSLTVGFHVTWCLFSLSLLEEHHQHEYNY